MHHKIEHRCEINQCNTNSTNQQINSVNTPKQHTLRQYPLIRHLLMVAFILWSSAAIAHNHAGYSHDSGVKTNNASWMSRVDGTKKIAELSIPGTHDTMTYSLSTLGHDIDKTQSMDLQDQLESGIRALDIRCQLTGDNKCDIYHGITDLNANLDQVLSIVTDFLKNHPSEAIFMRLNAGNEKSHVDVETWKAAFETYMAKPEYKDYIWTNTPNNDNNNPKLNEVRQHLVIMRDKFDSKTHKGISYNLIAINKQDDYELATNWDLYSKWEKVNNQLSAASKGDSATIYVNYLSGSTGAFPYFVASGHSSPYTGAPRLSTGLTTPLSSSYPDFPRTTCLFSYICTISFEGTNVLTTNKLFDPDAKIGRVGFIMADFPGGGLIDAVIGHNPIDGVAVFRGKSTVRDDQPDWDYGYNKASCAKNEAIIGISVVPTDHMAATALCGKDETSALTGVTAAILILENADQRRAQRLNDWSLGYFKLECGFGEYISAVSQYTTDTFHRLRCAKGDFGPDEHGAPVVRIFDSGNDQGQTSTLDWAPGQYKGSCGDNEVAVGVSFSPRDYSPHALLCSPSLKRSLIGAAVFRDASSLRGSQTDWDPNYDKAACATGEAITGLSVSQSDHMGQTALCEEVSTTALTGAVRATLFITDVDRRRAQRENDWSPGYQIFECGMDEYVSGVSQSGPQENRKFHAVQCAAGGPGLKPSDLATVRVFENGDARGKTSTGEWAFRQHKGECANGEVVVGVSVASNGRPHAILCSQNLQRPPVNSLLGQKFMGSGGLEEFQGESLDACINACSRKPGTQCTGGTYNATEQMCRLRSGAGIFQPGIPNDQGFMLQVISTRTGWALGGLNSEEEYDDVPDLGRCTEICKGKGACLGATFNASDKQCRLRSDNGWFTTSQPTDQAFLLRASQVSKTQTGWTFWGSGATSEFDTTTLSSCMDTCTATAACSGGTFNESKHHCWLRSGNGQYTTGLPTDQAFIVRSTTH
ncbi:phosphatidylinositol-specific phospholipase C domain-containing protein [Duganella sp. FT80W]|uniref:1-phosphatidylinositol phosphodiesterase n=1 Tax=Duganella guangzhouensis TaxID=2666084 RepID=A0A6I2KZ70_9BURK|nr:phosphatidylinositol-specific phospholipase C domain-containing protein [Duganella guangzhouensis]MRW89556.1 phosphatidylinositol-specific phospholipase C domain-containing protein [Duganella guangzhouensis]